jgi:hypothetical protein
MHSIVNPTHPHSLPALICQAAGFRFQFYVLGPRRVLPCKAYPRPTTTLRCALMSEHRPANHYSGPQVKTQTIVLGWAGDAPYGQRGRQPNGTPFPGKSGLDDEDVVLSSCGCYSWRFGSFYLAQCARVKVSAISTGSELSVLS